MPVPAYAKLQRFAVYWVDTGRRQVWEVRDTLLDYAVQTFRAPEPAHKLAVALNVKDAEVTNG